MRKLRSGTLKTAIELLFRRAQIRATRHVIELRHKKIAYLRGPMFWRSAKLRYAGCLKELKAAGLQPGPVVAGNWSAESGFETIRKLLES